MASQPVRPIKRDSSQPGEKPGGLFTLNPYLGAAITTEDTRYKRIDFKDMRESSFQTTHQGGWVAMIQHYFVSAWIPNPDLTHNFHLRQLGNQRSEEHTSELQSRGHLVCRLLLEKKQSPLN